MNKKTGVILLTCVFVLLFSVKPKNCEAVVTVNPQMEFAQNSSIIFPNPIFLVMGYADKHGTMFLGFFLTPQHALISGTKSYRIGNGSLVIF